METPAAALKKTTAAEKSISLAYMKASIRSLLLALCISAALLQNYGCNKAADNAQLNTKTNPPDSPDSSAKVTATRNCIDSLVGVYYGYGTRGEDIFPFGGPEQHYMDSGPDTIWVVKNGTSGVYVRSSRMNRGDGFMFDSSQAMYHDSRSSSIETSEAWLRFLPAKDSIFYSYRFEAHGDHGILSFSAGAK